MDLCLSETEHKVPYLEFELDDSIFGLLTVKPLSLSIILVFLTLLKESGILDERPLSTSHPNMDSLFDEPFAYYEFQEKAPS